MSYDSEVLADSPLTYLRLDDTTGASAPADLGSWPVVWTYGSTAVLEQAAVDSSGGLSISNNNSTNTAAVSGASPAGSQSVSAFTFEMWADMGTANQFALLTLLASTYSGGSTLAVIEAGLTAPAFSGPGRDLQIFGEAGGTLVGDAGTLGGGPHHYVVSLDGAGTYTFYLDGAVIGTPYASVCTGPYELDVPAQDILIAGYTGAAFDPTTDCRFAKFAIYPTDLSSTRVLAHYTAGSAAPALLTAHGATAITVHPAHTVHVRTDGRTVVSAAVLDLERQDTSQRTVAGIVLTMVTPAIVDGVPTVPAYWAVLSSTSTAREGFGHIAALPDPAPLWNPYTSGWSTLPPPPTAAPWSGRWSVNDLPDPSGYADGFYWLGDPSGYDGTTNISAAAQQWNPDGSTPGAGAWRSHFPFKPSVTAVNHYLQGGGIVHHPKGVNFNSHFIEHMWLKLAADMPQPFTWVMAGMIAAFPTVNYVHTLLDAGVDPAARGINMSAADCNTPRTIFDDTPARTVMQATANEAVMATQTGGSILRARVPTKMAPCMFVGIFNGAHSYAGVYRPGSTVLQQGTLNNHPQRYLVMGRQNGWLAQTRASHLLMFEIRSWAFALTAVELAAQYSQLSSTYQFDAYRSR